MKKILLFGGTREEHGLLEELAAYPLSVTLCVASEYGRSFLPEENPRLSVRVGRMDKREMLDFIRGEDFLCTVDATHPYAVEVTRNLKEAAFESGIRYFRLLRESSQMDMDKYISAASIEQAAEILESLEGNVLITTGSKELGAFTRVSGYRERLYPRVLPTLESLGACLDLGFPASHIIAMQGPFSKEMNMAMLKQFAVKTLVTKDGGRAGGFPEKAEAARDLGVNLVVLCRPAEEGLSQKEIVGKIAEMLEGKK